MKKLILFLLLAPITARCADISAGETFADGQSVTAARLNNHVNGATIVPGFVINKSTASPVAGDSFLFYQAGSASLLRTTLTTLQTALFSSPTLTNVTLTGETVISGVTTPAQITSDQNDYNPTGLATATTLRLSTDATRNITGIAAQAAWTTLIIHNVGSFNITFNNQNAGSSANNRFDLASSTDITIPPSGVRVFQYDGTTLRWRAWKVENIAPSFTTLTDAATITWELDPSKVSQNARVTLAGSRELAMTRLVNGMTGVLQVIQDGTGSRKLALPGPSFTDGVGNNTTTFTSATATFVNAAAPAGDVGAPICQSGNANIPAGTTITSVTNGTTIVASATITTATGITFYLPGRQSHVSGGGKGAVALTTTANATDILTWIYDGTTIFWTKSGNFN